MPRNTRFLRYKPSTERFFALKYEKHLRYEQAGRQLHTMEEEEEVISAGEIKEMLETWERVSQFVEEKHSEKVATGRAPELFNGTCLTHFRNILKRRRKQTYLDRFFETTCR